MARAEAASASIRSDSIKGLAQSIAKPAYRRLLNAEPILRRAVPALIIAFLLTICVGALVQVLDHRRQALADAANEIEASAAIIAERLDRMDGRKHEALARAFPSLRMPLGRLVLLTNAEGFVISAAPPSPGLTGRPLLDILGP